MKSGSSVMLIFSASKAHIRKGRGLCCSFSLYAAFFAC